MSQPMARLLVTTEEALAQATVLAESASGGGRGDLEAAVRSLEAAVRAVLRALEREANHRESSRRRRSIAQVLHRHADTRGEGKESDDDRERD